MNFAKVTLYFMCYIIMIVVYFLPPTLLCFFLRKKLKKQFKFILTGILLISEITLTILSTCCPPVINMANSGYVLTSEDKAELRYVSDDFKPLFPLDPRIIVVTDVTENMAIVFETHYLFNYDTTHIYGGTPGSYEILYP